MRGRSLRRRLLGSALSALLATGCATTGLEELGDELGEGCNQCVELCSIGCAAILLAPAIVACGIGFVHGACVRCDEGPPPDPDSAEASASSLEVPPPPTVARAAMGY